MNIPIKSAEIVFCQEDDRLVLIHRQRGKITGLSFMQGDDIDIFELYYSTLDAKLLAFYNATLPYLRGNTELDRVNQAIWAFVDFRNNS